MRPTLPTALVPALPAPSLSSLAGPSLAAQSARVQLSPLGQVAGAVGALLSSASASNVSAAAASASRIAQAIAVLEAHSDTHGLAVALPVWAASLRRQGRYSEAFQVLYHQAPTMRATEVPSQSVRLLLATAWCELDICRLGRAQECVDELGALLRRA